MIKVPKYLTGLEIPMNIMVTNSSIEKKSFSMSHENYLVSISKHAKVLILRKKYFLDRFIFSNIKKLRHRNLAKILFLT